MDEKVTPAAEWAALGRKTRPLKLPSGAMIEILDSKMMPLMILNLLPMVLVGKVLKDQKQNETSPDELVKQLRGVDDLLKMIEKIVVNPPVSREIFPPAGVMSIMDFSEEDFAYIIAAILPKKGAEELAPFRGRADGPDAGSVLPPIRPETIGNNGAG